MGKKDKSANTGVSGAGTFSLDKDAHESALKKKDYGSGGDFDVLPNGDYPVEVENVEITSSTTEKTAGSVMYKKIQLNITEGEYKDRKLFASVVIAHKSTAGRLYNFLEFLGRDIDAIDPLNIILPEKEEIIGAKGIARVTGKRPWPKLTEADIANKMEQKYQNDLTLVAGTGAPKKKKKDKAERVR